MATRTPRNRAPRVTAPSGTDTPGNGKSASPANGKTAAGRRASGAPGARHDPDGGQGEIHDMLIAAVAETARLLEADGAMVYLMDAETGVLRFAHDAGIRSARSRAWVRSIRLPIGMGMFGRAVARRAVVQTDDYLADPAFDHAPDPDRVVADIGIRSMVAAPLVHGEQVFGALGAFSTRPSAFSASQVALVRALADHAAAAMANTFLIEALDQSRSELARRAEAERALREIATRITVLREPSEILQDVVKHAGRLVRADGVILDLLDPTTGNLHWTYDDGLGARFTAEERAGLWISVGVGATGKAVAEDRVVVAGDDLAAQFPPSPESTEFYERTGFHSMIAAPITGEAGALGVLEVYSTKRDAFNETDVGLVGALASQSAVALTNARLIDQLARSQTDLAEAAEAERTLREIAARVSAMRDQGEILQSVIDAAARLLKASGVTIDLIDGDDMAEAWPSAELTARVAPNIDLLTDVQVDPDVGVSGMAIRTKAPAWTGEYVGDERFTHTEDRDAFVRESGIHSVIAAPLIHRDEVLGVVNAYSERPDSFDATDAGLLAALADQAAVAIANARLIEELERSHAEIARRADAERTLREIAARVSAILDPAEVLQRIVDEAARLLDSDGARIDQYDPEIEALRWSYAAGAAMTPMPEWAKTGGLKPGQAVAGLAFAEQRPILTRDYLADERFDHTEEIDSFVRQMGIRAVISTPLSGEAGPIGTISVVSRSPGAYDGSDLEVLTALATQASIAIRNARLMAELERSRAVIERRAEAEHALREIAARITAIREPGDLLQRIVDEALRLLRADGAVIDEFDPIEGVLVPAYDAGLTEAQRASVRSTRLLRLGEGVSGKAMAEGRVIMAGDYLAADFIHVGEADQMAIASGIGDLIVAPIIGDEGPLGAIEVYRHERHAFDPIDEAVLGGLADQAAIAITNARLIEELERSRRAVALRAETERSLRDITARIAALREPDVILERVVEEAQRLLGTDGAHLTRMAEDGTFLIPVVVAGGADAATRDWLLGMEFPLGAGINGLAAEQRVPVSTVDYLADPRIPQEPEDVEVARRLGLRGMAAAPLRAPGGEVIGTLAISSAQPRDFLAEELDLLQGLADQAAIAITNSTLLTRLTESKERYRFLVENAPDLVWSVGPDARLTFLSDAVERMTGRRPDELLGQHFGVLVHESSRDVAELDWSSGMAAGSQELRGRVNMRGPDGESIPAEFIAMARLDEDGSFAGANGSVRDMRERDRLERELRESETRYRTLASSSPDMVFETDPDGRYTFLSDRATTILGWDLSEAVGHHFGDFVSPGFEAVAAVSYAELVDDPSHVHRARIPFRSRDGRDIPLEINIIGSVEDGQITAIHGVARDISERERLERELRESETRFRQLVQTTPDVIYRCDADGRFLFMAEGSEALFGRTPAEVAGMTFAELTAEESLPEAMRNFEAQREEHDVVRRFRYLVRHRDGTVFPAAISSVSVWEDGKFAGVQGTVRGISDQERLERELRESEERYRFLVENSPDVVFATDKDGRFTFISEAIETMTGYEPNETVGQHFSMLVQPETRPIAADRWEKLQADPAQQQVAELTLIGKDGRLTPVEVHSIGIVGPDGSFAGIHGATRDIGERERLQRELRSSEERYRYLVSASPDLVWVTDAEGQLSFVSEAAESMLGRSAAELIGRPYWDVFAPELRREAEVRYKWLARHPRSVQRSRLPFRHADGHEVQVEINGIGMLDGDRFVGAHGAARDVSDRDRLERDLRRQAGELAAGEERAHLARELHDSVTQALFSMTLVSRSVELLLDRDVEAARSRLTQLRDLQREALAEMRALIFELRPGNLEQDGLTRALKTHTAALQGRIGLPVVVESTLGDERLPLAVEETLYRIAQEALHNVVKHAAARQVRVDVGRTRDGVRLRIQDDGKGFDPTQVAAGHLGLAGMQARAARIGASFDCRSVATKGTTVEVVVPDAVAVAVGAESGSRRGPTPDPSIRDR